MSRRIPRDVRVPLAWYLAITLGVPLVNGAASRQGFWAHAATVLAVALTLAALRTAFSMRRARVSAHQSSHPAQPLHDMQRFTRRSERASSAPRR